MATRGPKIRPKIIGLIHHRALEEPRLPRDAVASQIRDEIERMGEIPPSEETLVKMISRERNREPNPLEEPWSLGMLTKYKGDFPPEIVPVLIDIEKLQMRSDYDAPKKKFTIRHAQWIARLYHLIKDIYITRHPDVFVDASYKSSKEYLWMFYVIADVYAKWEEMNEIMGEKHADTSHLDKEFFINEDFWELSFSKQADRYAASRALYYTVLADFDKNKKRKNDRNQ